MLGVFSATGQRLAYNDDIVYPSNTDSRVTINLTAGTRYYVGITNYSSSSRGSYTWTIDGPAVTTTPTDDAYENNDTLATAYNLGTSHRDAELSAQLGDGRFGKTGSASPPARPARARTRSRLSFQNSQGQLCSSRFTIRPALCWPLRRARATANRFRSAAVRPGTYYVDVYRRGGATNPNYSLTVNPPATTTSAQAVSKSRSACPGLTASQQSIFQQAADRWAQVITGDLPNATYRGQTVDDLLSTPARFRSTASTAFLARLAPTRFAPAAACPITASCSSIRPTWPAWKAAVFCSAS